MRLVTIACFFAGSLCFALTAVAQSADLSTTGPVRSARLFHPPASGHANSAVHPPAAAERPRPADTDPPRDAIYADGEGNPVALPAVQFFPSHFRDLWPASGAPSYLLCGLLGLLLLGLGLSALYSHQVKETGAGQP